MWLGLFSETLQLGPVVYIEICIYVVLIVLGANYTPSFGRLLPSGTGLIPLFPYLGAGLLKGGGNVGIPRQPDTGIRPKAYRFLTES